MKYILLGGVSYLFALAQMYFYTQWIGLSYAIAYAITQVCILVAAFVLSRHWIFNAASANLLNQGVKYLSIHCVFRFFDWCLFILLNNYIGIKYSISIFLAMGLVLPVKYFAYKLVVFNDK